MFKNVLLAVDGSEMSQHAAEKGMALAKRLSAKVTIVTVTVPWEAYFARELAVVIPDAVIPQAEYDQKRQAGATELMRKVWAQAQSAGIPSIAVHRSHREPHQAIIDVAVEKGCDLIVTGPHSDRSVFGGLAGSATMKLLTHTHIPVLVFLGP